MADAGQRHRGRILDLAELIENGVDATDHGREGGYPLGQTMKGRVGVIEFTTGRFLSITFEIPDDIGNRLERTPQIPYLVFLQMGALHADTGYSLAHVEEVLHREVVLFLLQPAELPHLCQTFVDLITISREGHFVDLLFPQSAEATFFQQPPDFIETKLMLEVIRVNHAAKVVIFVRICKKLPKNLFISKNLLTFAPAFKTTKHWRDGRVVDYSSLENYRTERYRGFESLSLRKKSNF